MFPNFRNGPPWDGPLWLTNPTVTARAHVMMAMGMVSVATGLRLDDALASLRAHAYAVDRTVDSIAQDTVHRNLSAAGLSDRRASAFRIHRCPYLRCDFPSYLVRSVTDVNGFVTVLQLTSGWNPGPQRPTNERSMAVTGRGRERVAVMVTVDAKFHPVEVHPTLGRARMDEDAETSDWKGEPTDAGEKG